jgi:hypothetical protein
MCYIIRTSVGFAYKPNVYRWVGIIWQGASNVFMARGPGSNYGMSKLGQEFLAGVLHHLPAILAFTAPNPNRLVLSPISSSILAILLPTD